MIMKYKCMRIVEKSEKISWIPYGVSLSGYNNGQSAAKLRTGERSTTNGRIASYWQFEMVDM